MEKAMLVAEDETEDRIDPEKDGETDIRLSVYEKCIYFISLIFLIMIFVIAAWSGILLVTGETESGGPLGIFMEMLQVNIHL
jgi:hypothetical protein